MYIVTMVHVCQQNVEKSGNGTFLWTFGTVSLYLDNYEVGGVGGREKARALGICTTCNVQQ